jgi:hypothetical protein
LPPYAIPNRPDEYKYIWFEYKINLIIIFIYNIF